MEEFIRCLYVLHDRISPLQILVNSAVGLQDSYGSDLSLHIGIGLQILGALSTFFLREDTFSHGENKQHDRLVEFLAALVPDLNISLHMLNLEEHIKKLLELKVALQPHLVSDIILTQVMAIYDR